MFQSPFPPPVFEENELDSDKEELLLSLLKKRQVILDKESLPSPEPLKISVKTATCSINKKTHIQILCEKINYILSNKNKVDSNGKRKFLGSKIVNIKYTLAKKNIQSEKEEIIIKNSKSNENFYNSVEIIINVREGKNINLKYFTNGRLTCTGCKEDDDGSNAVQFLINEIKDYKDIFVKDSEDENDCDELKITSYNIVNINANFFVGFLIDNHRLYSLLLTKREKFNLFTDYAPDSYQGVKIYFMWNKNQDIKNGVCICNKRCKYSAKKRNGNGENDCRRISIAVFSTGRILIAGSKTNEQLNSTYEYVIKILQDNYNQIVQYTISDKNEFLQDNYKRKNGVLLKKLKIKI